VNDVPLVFRCGNCRHYKKGVFKRIGNENDGEDALLGEASEKTHRLGMNEIPKGDIACQKDDGDENNDRGVDEFLVFLKSANLWI